MSSIALKKQRGISLLGLLFWAVLLGIVALIAMKVTPSIMEFMTIKQTVNRIASGGATTVQEIRTEFEKQKDIEYSITSISGSDLEVSKENDKIVISYAYNKEIELVGPVYILIKYQGRSK